MSPAKRNDLTHAETVIKDPDIIVLNDVETDGTLLSQVKAKQEYTDNSKVDENDKMETDR